MAEAPKQPADALGVTVRRSAVTDTVVPAALEETQPPPALDATALPPALDATALPAALDATALPGALDATVSPALAETLAPTSASDRSTLVPADPAATTVRTVGEGLREATVERFGEVGADRFVVEGELARGGLGKVLRARDPRTGRIVALKQVLRPSAELVARFAREALVTANLQHPSIVPVYEVGRWPGGEPYYAMKLVRGRALDVLIGEAKTTAARVALVPHVIAVADALAYAHGERVIHRDLKPANVLVGPYGETVVIDWGLARHLADDAEVSAAPLTIADAAPGETVAGAVMGTPAYMAPEQAKGRPLDERADVYAIGAILYHVLAGRRPYDDARSVDAVLDAVAAGPPRPLATLAPGVAPELITIAGKAMARDRDGRYPTARELAEDLRRFQAGQLVGAHRYSSGELVRRWLRRHRTSAATAAVALAALAVFGVVSVRRIAAERDRAHAARVIAERERADARDARALAEQRLGDSLEELGRQAALAGEPARALPFLAGAAAASQPLPPSLAVLLGQARAAYADLAAIAPLDEGGTTSGDVADGGRLLVTTSASGRVRAWDIAAARERWADDDVALVAAAPDGERLLAASPHGELTVRLAADGAVAARWSPPAPWHPRERPMLLAWSADGQRFAVSSTAGRVLVGAVAAPALVEGEPHPDEAWTLAFSPDGTQLATTADGEPLTVRDAATGAVRARLAERGATSIVAAWRGDGELVSADSDRTARRWRLRDRAVVGRHRQAHDLYGLGVAPDGERLVTFGDGDSALLWDVAGGGEPVALRGHRTGVQHAVFAGGRVVTADETGQVLAWDPLTGERADELPVEGSAEVVRAAGDRVLVAGSGRPRLWRAGLDGPLARHHGHTARVRDLVFAGTVLWSASQDGSARGVDVTARARPIVLGEPGFREPVIADMALATTRPHPLGLRSLTLTPDATRAVTAVADGALEVWDAATGARLATWRGHHGRARKVAFAADGATAYSVGDAHLLRWDVATGTITAQAELGGDGWDVLVLDDGRRVATLAGDPQRLDLWDAATLAPVTTPGPLLSRLRALYLVDGLLLLAPPDQVVLVDGTGQRRAEWAHGQAFAASLGLAGDRPVVAVSDARGEIVLHDRATLAPVRTLATDLGVVAAVAFRPDGRLLAATGGRRVELWDPASGQLLARSPDVGAVLSQLAWSPDGQVLAFAGGSGTVWTWSVPADDGRGLAELTACVSPLRLGQGALTTAPFDPASCGVLVGRPPAP